jgi:Ran GTPase-activating protein (RanGAP) involved in mRNA processing and transport
MARLTSLDLRENDIGDAGAASLAPSLALMARLTSLDLSCNCIGAAGAASLAAVLTSMTMDFDEELGELEFSESKL